MKSDLSNVVPPKSDESSVSSAASNSNTNSEDSSGNHVIAGHNQAAATSSTIGAGLLLAAAAAAAAAQQQGTTGLLDTAAVTGIPGLGVPQPAHQASNVVFRAFASFDGIHSGVPTKTTPTLTPTTLKNIEQTFLELSNDTAQNIPCQAGFVPPPFQFEDHSQDDRCDNSRESMSSGSNSSWQVTPPPIISEDLDSKSSSTSLEANAAPQRRVGIATIVQQQQTAAGQVTTTPQQTTGKTSRRNMGGRRPAKGTNLSPEEEEKRRIRRERNKMAAARCRRRREDHTNELLDETDGLEKKKQALQDEIKQLQQEKEDLEFLLNSHREHCRLQGRRSPLDRKPVELMPQPQQQQQQSQVVRLQPANDMRVVLPVKVKVEPEDLVEQPPSKRPKLILSNAMGDSLDTPTPTTIAPVLTSVNLPKQMQLPSGLVTPTASTSTVVASGAGGRPARPDSLPVRTGTTFPLLNMRNIVPMDAGVGISTPSSGLFNFDSLMDGGTGLTPIAAPISLQSNRGPLDLITPTSTEPSKLCSL